MQSEAIESQSTPLTSIIHHILQEITNRGAKYHQQDVFIEKELINKIQSCQLASEKLVASIQKLIDSNKLASPNKYIVLMYASLLGVGSNHILALFSFYYKLASHALKEIKQTKTKNQQLWHIFFEKLYQYGMLLLTGNRTLLLSMQSLGMRVNSQLFANSARQMKLNKLVRIYNCILCIPQSYMSLKQALSLTLVFTRWSMSQNDAFTHSFFAAFQKKTQKKLIKKLSRYPKEQFIQQHILNLIKIVMCGEQMLFSYFLQAKVAYQCSKNQNIMGREKFALQGLKGAILLKEGKRLFNLVIKLLLQAREGPLDDIKREAILVTTLRFISSKFQNNEGLFNILIDNYLYEKNSIISQIACRIVREEALSYLTVYKVKLLLNLFNTNSWRILVKNGIPEELVIDRLAKINILLMALAHRYSNSNINLKCLPQKCGLLIQNPRDVKSLTFVIVFQDVGKLAEPDNLDGTLLKLKLDGATYQLKISFAELSSSSMNIEYKPQQKQRQGRVQIFKGQKQLLREAKQFIRYKEGSYISLVTASLGGKEGRKLNLSVDGSYYEFEVNKKSEIKAFQVARIKGTLQSFYALNIEISPVEFYKQWSEYQKKTNYVIQMLGKDKICYKLTNRLQTPILATVEKGWSLFKTRTQIQIKEAIKSPILLDIFLQLGGLETMFFILQRLSRTLLQFRGKQKKIIQLLSQFFQMIKLTASLDQSYAFLIQIVKCFKYINPFMFLLIKRNKFFKQTHDSSLLLNIFQMILYFRKERPLVTTPNDIIKKMKEIQIKFLVETLCNFEIWSGCSLPLQQFVLTLIQNFIKNEKSVRQLIEIDIYKQILGTLVLFATSETHLQNYAQLQMKLIEVCENLYRQIQKDFSSTQQIKQIHTSKDKQLFQNFIERDLFMSLSLLRALASKGFQRKLSDSQKSAFIIILRHITKTFIQSSYFKIIAKNWALYLHFLFNISEQMIRIDRQLLNALADTIMIFVSKQVSIDGCITIFFRSCIDNKATAFIDCLYLLHVIAQKYSYHSPGKSLVFQTILQFLQSKMTKIPNGQLIQIGKQIQILSKSMPFNGLFRLSQKNQYFQLWKNMREKYFNFYQTFVYWRKYSYNTFMLLCQHNKITQKNCNFIKFLLQNVYEDPDHPLASIRFFNSTTKIKELKELAKSPKNSNNQQKINMKGIYSLIDHCRGWLTLYFLHDHSLLNDNNDLCIPFLNSQISTQNPPGGIIPYYLSGKCQLHELYLLLNIIVYRELGNKISYLATLVPVVIYQQTVEKLIQEINKPSNEFSIAIIIILLKEVHNSLNNGYIIKTGTVCKDIQRLLGSVHQDGYRKKQVEAADALARASTRIQLALQESKTDKELAFLLELEINVIKTVEQNSDQQPTRKMLKLLVEQIKRIHYSVFQRLKIVGLRFFEVSKEHWLYNKQPSEPLEPKSQKMAEIVLYDNSAFQRLLEQNYQKLLHEYNQKGIESQKNWQNLLISNTYWFQHQGDLSDLSTKFYQLDQKEIGPFGFYKLGIKPVRTDLQKLPFPRRQQYKELIFKKEQQRKLRDIAPRQTILNSKSRFFTQFTRESMSRSVTTESVVIDKQKKLNNQYWCQWVTKRGVYAGKLCKRDKKLEFTFTGHSKMPEDREFQMSTNKCHWIQQLSQWQLKQFGNSQIAYLGSEIFTRRYILRHTAFQIFNPNTHKSYFFNLFFQKNLQSFLSQLKSGEVDLIVNRPDTFNKRGFTEKWIKGELSNFEYLCFLNRYSGRTTNDLAQYPVFPWVMVNFNGKDGFTQINQKFMNQPNNMRDLTKPTGKLGQQKFNKLKSRLEQIDPADREIRFLYGTMFSNPTVLYNFFIRLQPYTSLHWAHQSGKLDHADRLFSGVYEQFITILTSSSDMKELCPQFYYWSQFLRNRNRIQLGRKQKGDEVDAVILPVWAKNPQEFIFKMREVLESPQVTKNLHYWIDLIFGQKAPYQKAEQNDNLYHIQCYQQDIFTDYESQAEMKTAQIAISQFGQVPQQIFDKPHPMRIPRKEIYLDTVITISRSEKNQLIKGYLYNQVGLMFYTSNEVIFKKVAINGLYNNFQWTREYECQANSLYLDSIYNNRWIALLQGSARLHERKKIKAQFEIESRCLECMGDYLFFGVGSKITIVKLVNESFQEITQLFGHHSQVILIRTEPTLDLVVSVDRSGLVLIHQLIQLRFLRAFHLGTEFDAQQALKLRCCIHRMGYFIFFDHEQILHVYNYLGEQLLEQQMLIKTQERTQTSEKQDSKYQQIITGIQLFSHDTPIILASTSRGNIYAFNFLQIMRFKEIYPYKNYGRQIKNLLSAVLRRKNNSIIQFSMIRSLGTVNTIYQIIVLYDDGQLVCFSQNVQMTKQLSSNIRLKTMGIV